jgi:hypothetical protein
VRVLRYGALNSAALLLSVVAAPAASARVETVGLGGWQVQSTAQAPQSGAQVSSPGFATAGWLHVRPDDAGAVGTEVNALVQNGRCPNVFFSTNMKDCFGYMSQIGPDTIPEFAVPWWFRTSFHADLHRSQHAQLIVNGVVGEADVWVNGTQVASRAQVQGAYTRYTFDVTGLLHAGANALALELYPNDPTTMFTLDNVYWTQIAPDNNTGIQFPIQLHTSGPLALSNAHVVQSNAPDLSSSELTLKADVANNSDTRQTGDVSAVVTSPNADAIRVHQTVSLAAGKTRTITFTPNDESRLRIEQPRVWWPYQMGDQPLYGLTMAVSQPGQEPDGQSETFGIRTITTRLVRPAPVAPHGSRQFLVNGRPFVFRGGGWSEDLFLRYSSSDTVDQIALIRNLGLNGIRTEGKQMPDDFYERMDRAGILVDAGFQCCDAWQLQDSGLTSNHDFDVLYLSARTIGENIRNHPSILNFSWSDNQFEAYIDHSTSPKAPSTGLVYWQLNKGWPTLLWDLYNHDFDQAGSYFGAQKANKPLHALYAYDTGTVDVDNLSGRTQRGLSVRARVYDVDGKLLDDQTATGVRLRDQGVAGGVLHPAVPAATSPPASARTYFVELVLRRRHRVIDRNAYWLSARPDVVDWSKTIGSPQATMTQFADLSQLQGLRPADVSISAHSRQQADPDGADTVTDVTITNTSSQPAVAFFLRADVRRGTPAGTPLGGDNEVLPIFWNDNDITLSPGESETLTAAYRRADLRGSSAVVSVGGWNVPTADVPAP